MAMSNCRICKAEIAADAATCPQYCKRWSRVKKSELGVTS